MEYEVTRDVTVSECNWLDNDIKKGTIVYRYHGATYGCVSPYGIACTMEKDKTPFLEIPRNALRSL